METVHHVSDKEKAQSGTLNTFKRIFSFPFFSCYGRRCREQKNDITTDTTPKTEPYQSLGFIPTEDDDEDKDSEKFSYNSKELIPLRQFLRYTITSTESHKFQRQRWLRPSRVIYEVEWEKGQWLPLDPSTNKYIEELRSRGFSKVAIRNDDCLKKHISYDNPSPFDILLELSLDQVRDRRRGSQPICCHQPSTFAVRRVQWWQTSYAVGEAHLPKWVDPDLCCNAVMMNAPSVMAVMANISRSSSCFFPKSDSPLPSHPTSPRFKPLKYNPPVLIDTPIVY
ncbi:hypothetical protein G6F56_006560 [Rhizopus delemar]|uniref:WWE domain-containing protein n=1 Tax=Rhizopus stolonifer TaxID=4846 RepID=A0A367KW26_RHIST|nr:hypothetical protein G6F56_006560 [Rhizopus delemar]RCI06419.1 hypothetical protein CU098_013697 [Rhizopus stolonifer]